MLPSTVRRLLALVLALAMPALTARAEQIVKSFEFGPGTANTYRQVTKFTIPSGTPIKVIVTYSRLGPSGSASDLPISIDLHSPTTESSTLGFVRVSKNRTATRTSTSLVLYDGDGDGDGCEHPWHVVVRSAEVPVVPKGATPPPLPVAVQGTITFEYNDAKKPVVFVGGDPDLPITIDKGLTVVKEISLPTKSGFIKITGEFHTDPLDLAHFNSYHMLKVRLLRNGTSVASQTAYSQHAPSDRTPQLAISYFVSPFDTGKEFKLEITNTSPVKIVDFRISRPTASPSTFQPGCQ